MTEGSLELSQLSAISLQSSHCLSPRTSAQSLNPAVSPSVAKSQHFQRRNLLRLTAAKAEFAAAHSRKHLTVCLSFSRRQRLMLFFINHRQHLCYRSVKLSRYFLTYVYRLVKPSCERTVFSDIYIMLLRHCNYPQCQ